MAKLKDVRINDDFKKMEGYIYRLTYNDTNELFIFKDKYYKTFEGVERFYKSLKNRNVDKISIKNIVSNKYINL